MPPALSPRRTAGKVFAISIMKHKKIKNFVKTLEPLVLFIKKSRKRKKMPFKEIEAMLKILFPKTKHYPTGKGYFKRVFTIHDGKRKFVLKMGSKKHIRKDWITYSRLKKNFGEKKAHAYFAKIYWREGLFMLQKYGKKVKISDQKHQEFKEKGKSYGLIDIKKANIMKVDGKLKVVDAERSKK